ncbi:MAG TPA: hypothetical protein VFH78_09795 [Candidatus Thermoplasmatota archaeon]|nr:hypothetical protein [Candidatus Thermoplasmatota archaeon]
MRGVALLISVLLLVPLAHALVAPRVDVEPLVAPFPTDITDAEVLMLLAPQLGVAPTRLSIPQADLAGTSLGALVERFAARAELVVTPEEVAAFDALDPRLALPVATMLLAMEQAWTLRDRAFADWTPEEIEATQAALREGAPLPRLPDPQTMEDLVNAAILLSDAIESIVIPQLQAAADAGVWPATAVADAAGVLRVGGTGNDVETLDRFLMVDARGDDTYHNNAGGGFVSIATPQRSRPVAVAIDLRGNDVYRQPAVFPAFGAGAFGLGVLYALGGDDRYEPTSSGGSAGFGSLGVGIFRDTAGKDWHYGHSSLGYSNFGFGYFRDDGGDDYYRAWFSAGGFADNGGLGVFWDRGGTDSYVSSSGVVELWGYSRRGGSGWFVDESTAEDQWRALNGVPHPLACNDCTWAAGTDDGGQGNDNRGGLAAIIASTSP